MERKIEPQLVGLKIKHTTQVVFFFSILQIAVFNSNNKIEPASQKILA